MNKELKEMFKKIHILSIGLTLFFSLLAPISSPALVGASPASEIKSGVNKSGGDSGRDDLGKDLKNITNFLLFLVGTVAVIAIVISGLRFVTANGNQDQITSARNGVLYAVVGIVVALMAYAIVYFVVDNLG